MKVSFCLLLFVFATGAKLAAQDSLILIDRQVIECRTGSVSVHSTEVVYSKWGSTNNTTYAIKKNLVHLIRYNSGQIDTINIPMSDRGVPMKIRDLNGNVNDTSSYLEGFNDGLMLQDGLAPAVAGGAAGFGCGICGIAVPIAISTSKISPNKIPIEINQKKSNQYQQGLVDGMQKKRSRSVWTGYAVGVIPTLLFVAFTILY